jgi:large subunit ribosomal protein L4e
MFAPTKTWRRWHRKVNVGQKRYAVCSAIAASGVPGLVMARGHEISRIPEVPLVVSEKVEEFKKTKEAVTFLRKINAYPDIEKVVKSKRYRAGKGKSRNRRYKQKLGPLVIYDQDNGVVKAFRNIPGIDFCQVDAINILKVAPGGHLGRFIIWTEGAFKKLDSLYGTWRGGKATLKKDWSLPTAKMSNPDFGRLIRSEEIQKAIRPPKKIERPPKYHRNPLKRTKLMVKLNPYAAVLKRAAILEKMRKEGRDSKVAEKRAAPKKGTKKGKKAAAKAK